MIGVAAFAVLGVLLLAGCQRTEPTVVPHLIERKVEVPPTLLECMPELKAKEIWATQREVALFMERLALSGQDCRTSSAKVRKLLAE